MIVYHGTTSRRARRICEEGFLPRKPSRRVWFAESRSYALHRAKTQARRSRDRPVVLTCDLDLGKIRDRVGSKRLMHRNRVIAVDAPVPIEVLRSRPGVDVPTTPEGLARWVNRILHLKPHLGAGRHHPGIDRLSRWVNNRLRTHKNTRVRPTELLEMAQRWLPEFFENVAIDREHLTTYPRAGTIEVKAREEEIEPDPRADEALERLTDPRPKHRVRGIELLLGLGDPDLFDWCVMFLDDPAVTVRLAAMKAMLECEGGQPDVLVPLATSENKRIRAAALAALAHHAAHEAPRWFTRGLKDPAPCVRVAVARRLGELDAVEHKAIFELALYDPNPDVARTARKITQGKGYAHLKW